MSRSSLCTLVLFAGLPACIKAQSSPVDEIPDLESRLDALESEHEQDQATIVALQAQIGALQDDLGALDGRVGAIEGDYATSDDLTELQTGLQEYCDAGDESTLSSADDLATDYVDEAIASLGDVKDLTTYLEVDTDANAVRIVGANVYIQNGLGTTSCAYDGAEDDPTECNGLGNLIVGYAETDGTEIRNGSHNLEIGEYNDWTGYSGFVAGNYNTVGSTHAFVAGGDNNSAAGNGAFVGGGEYNIANGPASAILGGYDNNASGNYAVAAGGASGSANNTSASTFGGSKASAAGEYATVVGGQTLEANGTYSVSMGGYSNTATGDNSVALGGSSGDAKADASVIVGGAQASADYVWSVVVGGYGSHSTAVYEGHIGD